MGRGNQYIQLIKVLYCKLPTTGKQLPAFPHGVWVLNEKTSEVGGACITAVPPWPQNADIMADTTSEKQNNY